MADFNPSETHRDYAEHLRQEIHERIHSRMEQRRRHHSGRFGLFVGAFLVVFGILFLLQNLGVPYFDRAWQFWPVILIALGLGRVARGWGIGGRLWGGALVVAGAVLLLHNFQLIHGSVWNFLWPVILICAGLGMLAGTIARRRYWANRKTPGPAGGVADAAGSGSTATRPISLNILDERAIFGGVRRRIDSQEFEGGQATAIGGGIELDLSKAATKKAEIVIEANAIFGGIEIRVPEIWAVSTRGSAILGGYEDKTMDTTRGDVAPQTHLVILGSAIFGGVTIKN